MPASMLDAMVRHQIYIEGLKRERGGALALRLLKLNTDIKAELSSVPYQNLGDMGRGQVLALLGRLKKLADTTFNAWLNDLIEWLRRYMQIDRELLSAVWGRVSTHEEAEFATEDDGSALWGLIGRTPMGANGLLLLPFIRAYGVTASSRIVAAVNMGVANRQTPAEALAAIVGSPVADRSTGRAPGPAPLSGAGLVDQLNRQGAAVTNTILQHVAAQTNLNTAKTVFGQYLWVSVIDSGTTKICLSRNGHVFIYGKGPLPPAHVNCRSTTMPFDGTGPVTMPSFTVWAKGQPSIFVNDAFDAQPGSEYDGSRSLSLDAFRGKVDLITAEG